MWKIQTLKKNGRTSMKKNYAACLIISLIMVFLVSGPISITQSIDTSAQYVSNFGELIGSEAIVEFSHDVIDTEAKIKQATSIGDDSSKGVISSLYYNSKTTGTIAGGILLFFDKIFLNDDVSIVVIAAAGLLAALLFFLFIENMLRIGSARFFLENKYDNTVTASRLLLVFRSKKVKHCTWIMFLKMIFTALWFLTIVGGIIKIYSYRMIPYILAENPETSRKDAFRLSMEMMRGNKFKAFLLDVSFIPWRLVSVLTFGILRYLWLEPYLRSTGAELFVAVRDTALEEPLVLVPEPEGKKRTYDYHRHYTIINLILLFFGFAMFGWVWECVLQAIQDGHFVNRGSLYGPWIPIYGFGGVGLIVLLKRFMDKPILTFFMAILVCGLLEGLTGWYLDAVRGVHYWNYDNYYFNIGGYVCLESLLVFGLGGCMFMYLLAPIMDAYLNKIPKKGRIGMCVVLVTAFMGDVIYSHFNPHLGAGIGSEVSSLDGDSALPKLASGGELDSSGNYSGAKDPLYANGGS